MWFPDGPTLAPVAGRVQDVSLSMQSGRPPPMVLAIEPAEGTPGVAGRAWGSQPQPVLLPHELHV